LGRQGINFYEAGHLCGNAACLNPLHMRWITRHENNACALWHKASPEQRLQLLPQHQQPQQQQLPPGFPHLWDLRAYRALQQQRRQQQGREQQLQQQHEQAMLQQQAQHQQEMLQLQAQHQLEQQQAQHHLELLQQQQLQHHVNALTGEGNDAVNDVIP
jgi:hypothetical protein